MMGLDPAISPTPYDVATGPQAVGDLRPRQAQLPPEPFEPLREVQASVGTPASPVHTCLLRLVVHYWPGPVTVNCSGPDSFLASSVQMAPWAEQSVVAFRAMATSALGSGVTVISQRMFLPGWSRRT